MSGMPTDFLNSSVEDTNPSVDTSIVCMDNVLVRTAFDMSLHSNLYLFVLNSFDAIMFDSRQTVSSYVCTVVLSIMARSGRKRLNKSLTDEKFKESTSAYGNCPGFNTD